MNSSCAQKERNRARSIQINMWLLNTCMQLLQRLIGKEAEASIGGNTQYGGSKASIQCFHALFSRDPHKHMQNVTVPKTEKY